MHRISESIADAGGRHWLPVFARMTVGLAIGVATYLSPRYLSPKIREVWQIRLRSRAS